MSRFIQTNYPLKSFNTFRLNVTSRYFARIKTNSDIHQLLSEEIINQNPIFILGGGSNTLFTNNFEGLVLHVAIRGIKIITQNSDSVLVEIGAGEEWQDFVTYAVSQNWGGIENLGMIPGTIGGAAVQNIAAYGQNLEDSFVSLTAANLSTGKTDIFNKEECKFSYRNSVFKHELQNKYLVTHVQLKLSKKHQIQKSYYSLHSKNESLEREIQRLSQKPYTIQDVYQAVVNIRTRQLPNINDHPSVGSFFINPIITTYQLKQLQKKVKDLQFYPADKLSYAKMDSQTLGNQQLVKIPVGRLLDELGWRGKQIGNVRNFERHAMIVTHNGKATGSEILNFTNLMKQDFYNNYNIHLETEVTIV